MNKEDYEIITAFISSLEMRVPASKLNITDFIDQVLYQTKSLEKQFMKGKISTLHKELKQAKETNTAFSQSVLMSLMINRWRFSDLLFLSVQFEGDDQFFITSDFPTSLIDFTLMNSLYGIPPNSPTAEMTIPLTPNIAVFVNNIGANGYINIGPNFVREVNYRTLINSGAYVISPYKLNKNHILHWTNRFPQSFVLMIGGDSLRKKQ